MTQHEIVQAEGQASNPRGQTVPQRRIRRDTRQWRALIAEHDGCGLSTAEFCRQRDVAAASFYHWRRMLRGVDGGGGVHRDAVEVGEVEVTPRVVRLEADTEDTEDAVVVEDTVVVAELPGGVRVSVPAGCLRELLDGLLRRSVGGEAGGETGGEASC